MTSGYRIFAVLILLYYTLIRKYFRRLFYKLRFININFKEMTGQGRLMSVIFFFFYKPYYWQQKTIDNVAGDLWKEFE